MMRELLCIYLIIVPFGVAQFRVEVAVPQAAITQTSLVWLTKPWIFYATQQTAYYCRALDAEGRVWEQPCQSINGTEGNVQTLQAVAHGTNVGIGIVTPASKVFFCLFDTSTLTSSVFVEVDPGLQSSTWVAPLIVGGKPCLVMQDGNSFYGFPSKGRAGVWKCAVDSDGAMWTSGVATLMTPHFDVSSTFMYPMARLDSQGRPCAVARESNNYWISYSYAADSLGSSWNSTAPSGPQDVFRNPSFTLLPLSDIPVILAFNDQSWGGLHLASDRAGTSWSHRYIDQTNWRRANRAVLNVFTDLPTMVVAHIFPNRTWQRIVSVDGGATWSSATPIGPNEEDLNQADDLMSVGTVVNGHPAFVYVFGNGTHSFLRYSRSLDVYGLSWGQPACGLDGCHINGQFNAGDEIQGDLQVTTQLSITSSTTFAATAPLVVVTGVCIINQGTILQLDIGKQSNLTAGTALPTLLCKGGIAGSFQGSLVSGSCFTSIQSEVQQTSTLSSLVIVSSSPSPQCQGGAGLTTGAIIGISVGCVVAGLAIAVAVALIWRCQQKRTAKMFRTIAIRQQAAATTSLSL